ARKVRADEVTLDDGVSPFDNDPGAVVRDQVALTGFVSADDHATAARPRRQVEGNTVPPVAQDRRASNVGADEITLDDGPKVTHPQAVVDVSGNEVPGAGLGPADDVGYAKHIRSREEAAPQVA